MREVGTWLMRASVLWLIIEAVWENWGQDRTGINVPHRFAEGGEGNGPESRI